MSTESNDQYRAGFEAIAQQRSLMIARRPDGHYRHAATQTAWEFWLIGTQDAQGKREASTEPSAAIAALEWIAASHQNEQAKCARNALADIQAGALTDDAK